MRGEGKEKKADVGGEAGEFISRRRRRGGRKGGERNGEKKKEEKRGRGSKGRGLLCSWTCTKVAVVGKNSGSVHRARFTLGADTARIQPGTDKDRMILVCCVYPWQQHCYSNRRASYAVVVVRTYVALPCSRLPLLLALLLSLPLLLLFNTARYNSCSSRSQTSTTTLDEGGMQWMIAPLGGF